MPRLDERSVLSHLTRERLSDLARAMGLVVPTMSRDGLVHALSERYPIERLLTGMSKSELLTLCDVHGVVVADEDVDLVDVLMAVSGDIVRSSTSAAPVSDLALYRVLALLHDDDLGDVAAEFGFGSEQASEDRAGLVGDMMSSGLVTVAAVLEQLPLQVLQYVARYYGVDASQRQRDELATTLLPIVETMDEKAATMPHPQPVRSAMGSGTGESSREDASRSRTADGAPAPASARSKRG